MKTIKNGPKQQANMALPTRTNSCWLRQFWQ